MYIFYNVRLLLQSYLNDIIKGVFRDLITRILMTVSFIRKDMKQLKNCSDIQNW